MIELHKAVRGSYWWEKGSLITIDETNVESVEQETDRTPGGSTSNAYVTITMKSGVSHRVYGDFYDITRKLGIGIGL